LAKLYGSGIVVEIDMIIQSSMEDLILSIWKVGSKLVKCFSKWEYIISISN